MKGAHYNEVFSCYGNLEEEIFMIGLQVEAHYYGQERVLELYYLKVGEVDKIKENTNQVMYQTCTGRLLDETRLYPPSLIDLCLSMHSRLIFHSDDLVPFLVLRDWLDSNT